VGLTSQIHDFNPGIDDETGLFWTAPIDRGNVRVNLGDGSASLHVADLAVEDYGNVVNALKDGPSLEAMVSFDASWSGVNQRVKIRNKDKDFGGEFIRNSATLVWSGSNESGFRFQSDLLSAGFATIGHERNGSFFQ
jgi:hypothetical protein